MHKLIQMQIEQDTAYEHYAVSEGEIANVTDREMQKRCDELFDTAPIQFLARDDSPIDEFLKNMIEKMGVTVPIVWIKGSLYLIGINRINLEFKGEHIIA